MKNSIDIVAFIKAIFGEKFTGHITVLVDKYGTEIKTEKYKSDVFRVILPHREVVVLVQGKPILTLTNGLNDLTFHKSVCVAQTVVTVE